MKYWKEWITWSREYKLLFYFQLLKTEEDEKNKGFGFVSYEEAEAAVAALNGTEVSGKTIYVGRAQKKAETDGIKKEIGANDSIPRG